jgi:hypothetical protein
VLRSLISTELSVGKIFEIRRVGTVVAATGVLQETLEARRMLVRPSRNSKPAILRTKTAVSNRRGNMTRESKLETTLGDLVVALTEETERHVHDEKTAYEVVAYILANFVNSNRQSNQQH